MQSHRLSAGGRIDRTRPLNFSFDGRSCTGYAGDTLASALLANGVSIVGRSFKFHRPRGIVGCGPEETNAILQVGEGAHAQPNLKATELELYDGLVARSTKGWPNARHDAGALVDFLGPLFAAGFYYKTFMYPRALWRLCEHLIRGSAGFGQAPRGADPDRYQHVNAHCDVLVVGAGPAGLAAASSAARAGARVILADDQAEFGGRLLSCPESTGSGPVARWLHQTLDALQTFDTLTCLPRSTVFGYHDHNFLTIAEHRVAAPANVHPVSQRLWRVRARQVVLAQGAFERPLVFANNDRPGVMLASAVSCYVNRYAVRPGERAVVFTNNDSAYRAALDLARAGVTVAAVVDSRTGGAGALRGEVENAGIRIFNGHVVINTSGRGRLRSVQLAQWDRHSDQPTGAMQRIECDLLAMSGGWSPAVHLHSQAGGKIEWDEERICFLPGAAVQPNVSAGSCIGRWSLAACIADGTAAGKQAADRCGFDRVDVPPPDMAALPVNATEPLWAVPAPRRSDRGPKRFIDFQTDVTVSDVHLALREGYRNIEHVKRYTALGFGTDQGKLGNINGMAIVAERLGVPIASVGTTTFRPAYTPVTFGTLAGDTVGELYDPTRKTALHDWHVAAGAQFEVVGQWLRPRYFPRDGEDMDAAVARECVATRGSAGIMDASTLGKIDVQGPDALEFLQRVYTHDVAKLQIGRCAYGILLGEDGMIRDDGVMARLGEHHYYVTTTTGGAANVFRWLELWLQTEWPELQVHLTSLTDHYSTIVVAGADSRRVLQKARCSVELERDRFRFMTTANAEVAGCPARLFRVSFSGELAFEINVDSNYADYLWRAIVHAGEEFGITPYGTETMHVLRAEKGFVIVGQDTDGSVNPLDLGMKWLMHHDKDHLGRRSLTRPDSVKSDRKQLVGLRSLDDRSVIAEGAQLVDDLTAPVPVPMCGHVTSSYFSACLGYPIALALVAGGRSRINETVYASAAGQVPIAAKIVSPVFYDPKGERQNV